MLAMLLMTGGKAMEGPSYFLLLKKREGGSRVILVENKMIGFLLAKVLMR